MSHDDFCKCTFGEFESICKAWGDMIERQNHDEWERARTIATIVIQPHLKKGSKVTPQKLLPLPWDNQIHQTTETPILTAEKKRKRFQETVQRLR